MAQEDQSGFVRWQEITREHFSSVCNLILALATGLLAFYSTQLLDKKLTLCCAFGFAAAALIALSLSVAFALWCSINRLRDFRLTTQISRLRENGETELQYLRDESKSLGKFTWGLFWFQLATFGIGAACGALAVVIQVWPR
ncbi:hypothetical protein [Rhodocyclus tenuis]|uniref:Uncharacterized protein n=1 Tax=Rhodocyclus tenuis TaxID=1066 RepID=A0A840G1I1_RHOTE|nr:hypothetical protein [Rhodocyclus tenuis]MBB4248257.1 hypothetical protein [Rhodocyclus tenuis]